MILIVNFTRIVSKFYKSVYRCKYFVLKTKKNINLKKLLIFFSKLLNKINLNKLNRWNNKAYIINFYIFFFCNVLLNNKIISADGA